MHGNPVLKARQSKGRQKGFQTLLKSQIQTQKVADYPHE